MGNGPTPVSRHITIHLLKVDENIIPAKFRRLCLASPSLGVWGALLVWGGWALAWVVSPAGLWVHVLGSI